MIRGDQGALNSACPPRRVPLYAQCSSPLYDQHTTRNVPTTDNSHLYTIQVGTCICVHMSKYIGMHMWQSRVEIEHHSRMQLLR